MKIYSLKNKEVVSITPLLFFIFQNDDIVNNIFYIKTIGDGNNHISFGWENQDLKAYIDDSLVLQNIATYVDASNMSLQQLVDYKNKWRTPFLFYIDYTSNIAPDDNTLYGIASKEMLIAFSYSGNIYRCVDGQNWILCSKDWDDLPNDLVLRRIFDKDANNSHMIEMHWEDGLQFWVDGGTMVFNTANFQAGVSTLYNKCTQWGVTPSSNSPTDIANAIDTLANNRWEAGRLEVTSNPNKYNLFTAEQYNYARTPVIIENTAAATRNNTNFTLDVTIPKNLTYVCAGITGVEGATGYDDRAEWKMWSAGTSWTYTASSGVIRFVVSPGGGTYLGANCKITYKIMYLNNT